MKKLSVFITTLLLALAMLPAASANAGGPPATFTTINFDADGGNHCKNGQPDATTVVNCNIYDGKQYVWLNGGPANANLAEGMYFFAVLVPGGQPDPNDGGAKNLSDTTLAPLATGSASGDVRANRTFTVAAGGVITYTGSAGSTPHDFDVSTNQIRLMPYDDTTNNGGVYILAICEIASVDATVNPRTCKYDAFKVQAPEAPVTVAAQLGLKMRRVVIDPGHGGRDTGAVGPHGVREKDVALSIARTLAERLRTLGFAVVLTRKGDTYVSLDERTRIANEAHADLFVSIHCNAARRRTLSGVETWTLNVASDRYATRLATFENADAERTVSDLRLILADLATRANASDARDLAQSVQGSLVRNLRARVGRVGDHGVKHALFYVLLGARMPAVLVETGFISNSLEEERLRGRKYQLETAEAIARGVKEFVDGRQRLARVP